ncbi:MAG TPA: EamA family transporter [Actinomycetota bacterium]|nr:EamA family transporter [Actinomycetota bacterium]
MEVPTPDELAAAHVSRSSSAISVAILLVSVAFAIGGQFMLKSAMDSIGRFGSAEVKQAGEYIGRAAREPRLWGGLALFGCSAAFWLVVLSRVPLSLAYPFVGISYIVVVLIARFALHEEVPPLRWVGVALVALGIAVIGASSRSVSGT